MALLNKRINYVRQLVCLPCLFFLSSIALAAVHPKQEEANKVISQLYHNLNNIQQSNMEIRLQDISAQFLGKPYLLGALGEGVKARFDQAPRYRVDAFDCETYVTTVLALTLADNLQNFKQCLSRLRYKDGQVSYLSRNHFTSVDWNKNNQKQGFLQDITPSFKDKNKQSVALATHVLIDKASWYQHRALDSIRLYPSNPEEQFRRLAELKARGSKLPQVISQLPYIPFTALFQKDGQVNEYLFSQIPTGSIIEIVRPDWHIKEQIGTDLDISHLGFAIRKNGVLFFREASSVHGQVVDVPLIDYLKEARNSPTIKGINVQIILPKHPLPQGCS
jgi:hypothetical protein